MTTPTIFNLPDLYRGDSYGPLTFQFKDSLGNLINFSGARVDVQVKNKKCVTALYWSTENGSIEIVSGDVVLNRVDSNLTKIPVALYDYDLQIIQSGIVNTYLKGKLNVIKDITEI